MRSSGASPPTGRPSRSAFAPSSRASSPRRRGSSARWASAASGDELAFTVRRAGGAAGPRGRPAALRPARRGPRLVPARAGAVDVAEQAPPAPEPRPGRFRRRSVADGWDAALAELPADWSDLLCCARARVERAPAAGGAALRARSTRRATTTAPGSRSAARARAGYGVSPAMARRCFERLDAEGIPARVTVLRAALRRRQRRHAGRRLVRRREGLVARDSGVRPQSDTLGYATLTVAAHASPCAGRTG